MLENPVTSALPEIEGLAVSRVDQPVYEPVQTPTGNLSRVGFGQGVAEDFMEAADVEAAGVEPRPLRCCC